MLVTALESQYVGLHVQKDGQENRVDRVPNQSTLKMET